MVKASLIYRMEQKQNRICKKTVSSWSLLCQSRRKSEDLWWEGFVKEVGFELGVKE